MYSRQQKPGKSSSRNNIPASNQFAPHPAVYRPQVEPVQLQAEQKTDLPEQSENEKSLDIDSDNSGRIDGAVFSRQVFRPQPHGIQLKLRTDQDKENSESEVNSLRMREQTNPVGIRLKRIEPELDSSIEKAQPIPDSSSEEASENSDSESDNLENLEPNTPIQTKLTIGEPGDKYEQEADSMAEKVMSMDTPTENHQSIQPQSQAESPIQKQPISTSINPMIQGKSSTADGVSEANPDIESRLTSQKGGGTPIDEQTRSFMEPRFGADFSSVRVHTDSTSVQMNQDLGAQAFTHGQDVYFGAGKYNPGADDGKRLLAHELTHVVQQTGAVQRQQQNPNQNQEVEKIRAKNLLGTIPELPENKEQGETVTNQTPENLIAQQEHGAEIQSTVAQPQGEISTQQQNNNPQVGEDRNLQNALPVKNLSGKIPEVPVNKDQSPLSQLATTAQNALPVKNLLGAIPEVPVNKDQSPLSQLATTAQNALPVKNLLGGTPEVPVNKDGANQTPEITPDHPQSSPAPQPASPAADSGKVENRQNNEVPASTQTDIEQETQPQPQVQPTSVTDQGGGAAPPDISGGGSVGEETVATDAGADQQIEQVAAETQGVQLESGESSEVTASLAEVGQGGGVSPALGGGGGGGGAIAEQPKPPVAPDVSQLEPSQALASISQLPPAQLLGALGGVNTAVGNTVGKQRAELAANPPQIEQPTGIPAKQNTPTPIPTPQSGTTKPLEKAPEGEAKPVPQPQPVVLPPAPVVKAVSPPVKGDTEGKLSAGDAQALQASLKQIPTTDPSLKVNISAPPQLELSGISRINTGVLVLEINSQSLIFELGRWGVNCSLFPVSKCPSSPSKIKPMKAGQYQTDDTYLKYIHQLPPK